MKKVNYFLLVTLLGMLTSCSVGMYYPHSQNLFGAQTSVQLNQANFRVVRDVEAVVEVVNSRLSRSSVEKSAYGQLLRNAKLTGSQVLINVVIEEIRRENRVSGKCAQYVAARATIIEFLDENGNPTVSKSYRPTTGHQSITQNTNVESVQKEVVNDAVEVLEEENAVRTLDEVTSQYLDEVMSQYEEYVTKLNSFGWNKSPMYKYYTELVSEFQKNNTKESIDNIYILNSVIGKVFNKEISKITLEKSLKVAAESNSSLLNVFISYK
jgi:hypothetical protein